MIGLPLKLCCRSELGWQAQRWTLLHQILQTTHRRKSKMRTFYSGFLSPARIGNGSTFSFTAHRTKCQTPSPTSNEHETTWQRTKSKLGKSASRIVASIKVKRHRIVLFNLCVQKSSCSVRFAGFGSLIFKDNKKLIFVVLVGPKSDLLIPRSTKLDKASKLTGGEVLNKDRKEKGEKKKKNKFTSFPTSLVPFAPTHHGLLAPQICLSRSTQRPPRTTSCLGTQLSFWPLHRGA